jgi:hypothetical protein
MRALIEAVMLQAKSSGPIGAIATGGVFGWRADVQTDYPCLMVGQAASMPPRYDTGSYRGGTYTELVTVRFWTFCQTAEAVQQLMEAVEKEFTLNWPTLSSGSVLSVAKGGQDIDISPDLDNDQNMNVYQGTMDVQFLIERNPTA